MLTGQFRLVGPHPHAAVAAERERFEPLGDEQLLSRFLNRDNKAAEAAFRAIVARHGPMVLGVCRHILSQHQDAEDAFQATFLVLARKAGSIRDRRVLARWLYEVAYRIAMRAKTNGVRRRAHERQGGEMAATVPIDNHGWSEIRPVLHDEVNRLPEKYRVPVILCYLEGKTNEEAAQLLQWPVGTVKGRLSRARDLLRSRLTRRGLALSAALLVTALSNGTVIAEVVPMRLVDTTVTNAMVIAEREAAEAGAIAPEVSRLMDLAGSADWAYKVAAVAALLVVIVSALASLGLSPGNLFGSEPTVNSFLLWPLGGKTVAPALPGTPGGSEGCGSHEAP
jgi:RNA polymerase sigma factor (sigma-70 family)